MNILLFIHLILTLALIGVILIQRSEGGGAGLGTGSSGNMFSARGAANLLTRVTGVLASLFFLNCLLMGIAANRHVAQTTSLLRSAAVPSMPTPPASPSS